MWDKTEVELHPKPGDTEAVGTFAYQNKGDKPVHIASVHTSCGCTTAGTKKDDIAPGEKGEITATFKIGDRTGVQQKTVTVQTDDPKQPTTVLTLTAYIASPLDLQPSFIYWNIGEEPKPKTITAKADKAVGVKKIDVTSSNANFLTRVEPTAPGEFRIVVTPRETTRSAISTLSVKTDAPSTSGRIFYASARVVPSAPAH